MFRQNLDVFIVIENGLGKMLDENGNLVFEENGKKEDGGREREIIPTD